MFNIKYVTIISILNYFQCIFSEKDYFVTGHKTAAFN